jgi:hypothetical protein
MEQVMYRMKKHMTRNIGWMIAGFALLLIGFYYFYILPYSRLIAPINDQLEAIRIEDNATAYSFTSKAFQDATSMNAFISFIKQYSSLRNNESITINSRQVINGFGKVKAVLISRGGLETPVTYQLVQENDRWKIESMILAPQGDEDTVPGTSNTSTQTSAAAQPTSAEGASTTTSSQSVNTFKDPNNTYSLIYPDGWQSTDNGNGKIVFNGQAGSESSMSSFTVFSIGNSGDAQSVQQISDNEEALIKQQAGSFKVDDDGLLPPHSNKNERYHGKYTVYSYTVNGQPVKKLQVIYFINPKHAQFVIDFTAPAAQYETDLPAAKAMIASFTIA